MKKNYPNVKLACVALISSMAIFHLNNAMGQLAPNLDFLSGAKSYTYKSDENTSLRLHVFQSLDHSSSLQPAIVFFFGGGWRQGRITHFLPHAEYLRNRGMVSILADYRVLNRHGTDARIALSDAKSAIRWVRENAAVLGIDPSQIIASGGSAGGHLAAATSVVRGFDSPKENLDVSSKPNALALFNPALDLPSRAEARRSVLGDFALEISPLQQLSDTSVPTLIQHGIDDRTVPFSDAQSYCQKLKLLGGECTLFGYEEADHGFFNKGVEDNRWFPITLERLDKFLVQLGYIDRLE